MCVAPSHLAQRAHKAGVLRLEVAQRAQQRAHRRVAQRGRERRKARQHALAVHLGGARRGHAKVRRERGGQGAAGGAGVEVALVQGRPQYTCAGGAGRRAWVFQVFKTTHAQLP